MKKTTIIGTICLSFAIISLAWAGDGKSQANQSGADSVEWIRINGVEMTSEQKSLLRQLHPLLVNDALPENWYISRVHPIESPDGWEKVEGENGLSINISRQPYSYRLKRTKGGGASIRKPTFQFCIMPAGFSGKSAKGDTFADGELKRAERESAEAIDILDKVKRVNGYLFFYGETYFQDWENPSNIFNVILNTEGKDDGSHQRRPDGSIYPLEGIFKKHPKFLYTYYLTPPSGKGQLCALFGKEKLRDIKPGSKIHVEGHLGTRFHDGGNEKNPSPFPRMWFIYMKVETVRVLRGPKEKPNNVIDSDKK